MYTICSKPIKKTLEIHRGFNKAINTLIVQIQIEKITFKKFLYFGKVPGFDLPEYL